VSDKRAPSIWLTILVSAIVSLLVNAYLYGWFR
jgi:hypothetical protein